MRTYEEIVKNWVMSLICIYVSLTVWLWDVVFKSLAKWSSFHKIIVFKIFSIDNKYAWLHHDLLTHCYSFLTRTHCFAISTCFHNTLLATVERCSSWRHSYELAPLFFEPFQSLKSPSSLRPKLEGPGIKAVSISDWTFCWRPRGEGRSGSPGLWLLCFSPMINCNNQFCYGDCFKKLDSCFDNYKINLSYSQTCAKDHH